MPDLYINSFIKGINQALDRQLIGLGEAHYSQNVSVSDGALGSVRNPKDYNSATLPTNVNCLMKYYHGGTGVILATSSGKILKVLDSTSEEILSGNTSDDFDYVNYQFDNIDKMILGNGTETTKVYDGFTFRDLKFNGKDSADGTDNKAPKGKYIELHKERLWVCGNSTAPNTIYFSKDFDPDDFTAPLTETEANMHGGTIDIPTWDGGIIVGMKALFDDVIVFKTHNVFKVFGSYPGEFNTSMVFDAVDGTIYDKSISSMHNKVFWTTNNGMYYFDGSSATKISDKVKDIFSKVNKQYINKVVAVIWNNKYIVALPDENSTKNNMVIEYDTILNNFSVKKNIEIDSFLEFDDRLLFVNSAGKIQEYEADTTHMSSASWESGLYSLGALNTTKTVSMMYITAQGSGSIVLSLITERGTKTKQITLSSNPFPYIIKIKNKGRLLSIKIDNVDSSSFKISGIQAILEVDTD